MPVRKYVPPPKFKELMSWPVQMALMIEDNLHQEARARDEQPEFSYWWNFHEREHRFWQRRWHEERGRFTEEDWRRYEVERHLNAWRHKPEITFEMDAAYLAYVGRTHLGYDFSVWEDG